MNLDQIAKLLEEIIVDLSDLNDSLETEVNEAVNEDEEPS